MDGRGYLAKRKNERLFCISNNIFKILLLFYHVCALIVLLNNKTQKEGNMNKVENMVSNETFEVNDTWNQTRTTEQLLGFIARREAEIFSTNA